ncbi:uncharacterized protein LOC129351325 [Poeciliopsis prolifica]|uniref:uncharacterized protein LOC129351325 n=1 Tax=Poeciliopsis prolifica TaxID=188132 RepID=UPI0024144687|nr:uncharacterized protein LOC129351325 [Poeciliopsis prolifica]
MKTKVKITLVTIGLCALFYHVFTKERGSSSEHELRKANTASKAAFHGKGLIRTTGQDNKRDLMSSKEDKTAVIGTNITLHCGIASTLQHNDILEWSKGNDEILTVKNGNVEKEKDYKLRFHLADSASGLSTSLNISHVEHKDSGSYSCCIKNTKQRCIYQNVVVKNESFTKPDKEEQRNASTSSTSPPQNETMNGKWITVTCPGDPASHLICPVEMDTRTF